ncbi:class A beta-lactamase [Afifella sp. JA880]|uniref:class A beta-lactamase n=1 Tax=Afifella sp. JA880 TaxID=2975280 RepID=UPI0021BB6FA4|nr:class A beta-lactamase [Afifella sp. JA880]MCT8266168.1 class A beta-lactamase [Afifella sp. JA880]
MDTMPTRRSFTALMAAMAGSAFLPAPLFAQTADDNPPQDVLTRTLSEVEQRLNARLGAYVLDIETGREWAQRADERFPMCSTFKLLACGAVLAKVDMGEEDLERRITFEEKDLVTYSPVTKEHVGGEGMTLEDLCVAAMTQSDNTAGNLILDSLGGPPAITSFARSIGDQVTRLDRRETELNEATPGDPRDTTSPRAMGRDAQTLLVKGSLSDRSRLYLKRWMCTNKTGDEKLRAGLPGDFLVGDKTGGGGNGTMNDVAVIWPSGRKPIIASIYLTESGASFDERNAGFAEIGKAIADVIKA